MGLRRLGYNYTQLCSSVYCSSDFGDGITLTPDCTQLREPMVTVTVEPSLQKIIRNWEGNTSEKTYQWSYMCEGNNGVSASQDFLANVSGGRSVLILFYVTQCVCKAPTVRLMLFYRPHVASPIV